MNTLSRHEPRPVEGSSYARLRLKVRQVLLQGQQKIERQKVFTYLETGKRIHEHLLFHKDRAGYGKEVIERLSVDLEISGAILYQCLQAYRVFKNFHARGNSQSLTPTWAHLRAAMRVSDEKKRLLLLEQAVKGEWTSRELEIEVRNHNWLERTSKDGTAKALRLPMVCLGPYYTYKIIQPDSIHSSAKELLLDIGFSHALEMSLFKAKFAAGTIITSAEGSRDYSLKKAEGATEDSLYTYKAFVEKVLDGDTLKVEFELGFGNRQRETIRLKAVDCPELDTPEGRAAKRFVESQLSGSEFITVKSIRTQKEKWGRYLGDVFYSSRHSHARQNSGGSLPAGQAGVLRRGNRNSGVQIYLNQLLLDKGHAVRVRM